MKLIKGYDTLLTLTACCVFDVKKKKKKVCYLLRCCLVLQDFLLIVHITENGYRSNRDKSAEFLR